MGRLTTIVYPERDIHRVFLRVSITVHGRPPASTDVAQQAYSCRSQYYSCSDS